jgi:glutamyl-tRNA reductase
VLGAGSVSELVVSQLRDRGIARLLVMNRSAEHAASLAKEFGGTVVPWGTWESALLTPDVVVSSVAAEEPVLCRAELERAMSARGNRALFLLDLGVPRNIEAAASELYNVYVYNLDDLSDIVRQNRSARESEIPRAELIIEEHVEKFLSWQASVDLVGVLTSLRERVTRERSEFLRERLDGLGQLTGEDRERVQEIVGELLERILIEPARQLRGERELRRKIQNVEALRDVFLNGKDKP